MGWGKGFETFAKYSPLARFGGRLFGAGDDDRKKGAPQAQYYGGSKEAIKKERGRFREAIADSEDRVTGGLKSGMRVQQEAGSRNQNILDTQGRNRRTQNAIVTTTGQSVDKNMANYDAGRGAILGNAGKLEQLANDAPANYMKTDQAAFAAQQDAAARQSQAIAAQGGAGGLRTALATNAASGAQAQQQANITRANEYNQLLEMQQSGLGSAANIRSGVGAQDQTAGSLQAQRQQAAANLEAGYSRDQAATTSNDANVGINVAGMRTNAGLAQQSNNLTARSNLETAQLGASQNYENQRQQNAKSEYTNKWFPMAKFNQPA